MSFTKMSIYIYIYIYISKIRHLFYASYISVLKTQKKPNSHKINVLFFIYIYIYIYIYICIYMNKKPVCVCVAQ